MPLFVVAEVCIIVSYAVAQLLPLNQTRLTDDVLYGAQAAAHRHPRLSAAVHGGGVQPVVCARMAEPANQVRRGARRSWPAHRRNSGTAVGTIWLDAGPRVALSWQITH